MTTPDIPLLDISAWRDGTASQRARIAGRMDQALRQSGFLLIENHGVPGGLRDRIRAEASRFFALLAERKRRYATTVAGRGWLPQGGEANAFYGEVADPGGHEGEHHQRPGLPDRRRRDRRGLVRPQRLAGGMPGA